METTGFTSSFGTWIVIQDLQQLRSCANAQLAAFECPWLAGWGARSENAHNEWQLWRAALTLPNVVYGGRWGIGNCLAAKVSPIPSQS